MAIAFVFGNGQSRQNINLQRLREHGRIYGCNAMYRDFAPDVLIAADRKISEQIQHSGYAKTNVFYTRKPLPDLGAVRVPDHYWGFSSGQIALGIAAIDRSTPVFMLGFDFGSVNDRFNNVYANTEFYKKSSDRPTYSGNWIRQTVQIFRDFPEIKFVRVSGPASAVVPEFEKISNLETWSTEQFEHSFPV